MDKAIDGIACCLGISQPFDYTPHSRCFIYLVIASTLPGLEASTLQYGNELATM